MFSEFLASNWLGCVRDEAVKNTDTGSVESRQNIKQDQYSFQNL